MQANNVYEFVIPGVKYVPNIL